jgi:hypothetical protein
MTRCQKIGTSLSRAKQTADERNYSTKLGTLGSYVTVVNGKWIGQSRTANNQHMQSLMRLQNPQPIIQPSGMLDGMMQIVIFSIFISGNRLHVSSMV